MSTADEDQPKEATAATAEPDQTQTQIESQAEPQPQSEAQTDSVKLEEEIVALKNKITILSNEKCDLEQRLAEESKRCADQIEELIAKSNQDDQSLSELKRRFELYSRETSSMIENFTTNREVLTSQLMELRQENDYLLAKFVGKSRDLQNAEVDLPQTTEELQFLCLTLNEKLILATMAKEELEETLSRHLAADR